MKKFISHKEMAESMKVDIVPMDSSDANDFNVFMKKASRESSKHSQKANITASRAYLTR